MEIINVLYDQTDYSAKIYITFKNGDWKQRLYAPYWLYAKTAKRMFETTKLTKEQCKEIAEKLVKNKVKPIDVIPNINEAHELTKYFFNKYNHFTRIFFQKRGIRFEELNQIVKNKEKTLKLIKDFQKDGKKYGFPVTVSYACKLMWLNIDELDATFKYKDQNGQKESFTTEGFDEKVKHPRRYCCNSESFVAKGFF